jgi:hypothetical protein
MRRDAEETYVGIHIVVSYSSRPFCENKYCLRNTTKPSAIVWVATIE